MSKDKIMDVLKENPSGLSISDLARKTGFHRNTISSKVRLLEGKKLRFRMVGKSKVYYLSHHQLLHDLKSMDKRILGALEKHPDGLSAYDIMADMCHHKDIINSTLEELLKKEKITHKHINGEKIYYLSQF